MKDKNIISLRDNYSKLIKEVLKLNKAMESIKITTSQIPSQYECKRNSYLTKLEVVFNREDIDKLYELIKSDYNTYGIDTEFKRIDDIWNLALKGFSFSQIYKWVEKQQEGMALFMIE